MESGNSRATAKSSAIWIATSPHHSTLSTGAEKDLSPSPKANFPLDSVHQDSLFVLPSPSPISVVQTTAWDVLLSGGGLCVLRRCLLLGEADDPGDLLPSCAAHRALQFSQATLLAFPWEQDGVPAQERASSKPGKALPTSGKSSFSGAGTVACWKYADRS